MSIVWRIVCLRWTLTWAVLRKSIWQTIGYVVGLLAAIWCVVMVAFVASWLRSLPASPLSLDSAASSQGWTTSVELIRTILVVVTTAVGIMWMIIPLTLTGEGSSLSPRRFVLYGIDDSKLTGGILLSALLGIPAIVAFVSMLFAASTYTTLGTGPLIVAFIAALLAIVVFVSISKALIALASSLVRSKRGQMILYVAVIALMIIAFQIPGQAMSSVGESEVRFSSIIPITSAIATMCAWTPWGAPFQLPVDVAAGSWGSFAARLIIIAVAIAGAWVVSVWCLRRDRLKGEDSKATVARGLGWLTRVPDSVSGAVTARIAQYWQRDGRLAMGLIMPVILTVIFMIRSSQSPWVLWAAPLTMGFIYPMIESNNLAYDGKAFTLHALAGVRGRDDRLGRARVSVAVSVFFIVVTSLIALVGTGAFTQWFAFDVGMAALGSSFGFVLAGIGLAEVLSCLLIYPVASIDKPFSSPQGRAAAQGFFPFIQMFGSLLLMIPTVGVGILVMVFGSLDFVWIIGIAGLLNGGLLLVAGIHLGGRILDHRMPSVISTLDNFASLQK